MAADYHPHQDRLPHHLPTFAPPPYSPLPPKPTPPSPARPRYHDNLNLVQHYDGQNCINTWPFKRGKGPCGNWSAGAAECSHAHRFERNKCLLLYNTTDYSPGAGGCPPDLTQMAHLRANNYFTPSGQATIKGCGDLASLQRGGQELGSTAATLPPQAAWLGWAHEILGMQASAPPPPPPAAEVTSTAPTMSIQFSRDFHSYSVVGSDGRALFAGVGIGIFCDGKMWTTESGLKLRSNATTTGDDGRGGAYTAVVLRWETEGGAPLITTAKSYSSGEGVAFEWRVPGGLSGTSQSSRSRDAVIVYWPAFTTNAFDGVLSWEGSFMGAHQRLSQGASGGPTVFFHKASPSTGLAVVGSPIGHWKASSAGENTRWDGQAAWAPGISATVTALPKGFEHGTWLRAGHGVTATIDAWGSGLRKWRGTSRPPDVTLEKIGYQTDNGAFYVFCRDANCSQTMLNVKAALDAQHIPIGYLSFQGAGASSGEGGGASAPWCVSRWGVDGGESHGYPLSVAELHAALGVPLQLYAPYCDAPAGFEPMAVPWGTWGALPRAPPPQSATRRSTLTQRRPPTPSAGGHTSARTPVCLAAASSSSSFLPRRSPSTFTPSSSRAARRLACHPSSQTS